MQGCVARRSAEFKWAIPPATPLIGKITLRLSRQAKAHLINSQLNFNTIVMGLALNETTILDRDL
jgi:hypothetical protein